MKTLQYHWWLGYVITISQQIYTYDFPEKNKNFIPFGNSIPMVSDKLISPLRTSIRKMILLIEQPINRERVNPPLLCNQWTTKKKRMPAKFNTTSSHRQYHISAVRLSRCTYVPLFLQTVKNMYISALPVPFWPCLHRKNTQVFQIYKTVWFELENKFQNHQGKKATHTIQN